MIQRLDVKVIPDKPHVSITCSAEFCKPILLANSFFLTGIFTCRISSLIISINPSRMKNKTLEIILFSYITWKKTFETLCVEKAKLSCSFADSSSLYVNMSRHIARMSQGDWLQEGFDRKNLHLTSKSANEKSPPHYVCSKVITRNLIICLLVCKKRRLTQISW